MKKNIAIVWGGYSSEVPISEKSAEGIYSFIDKERYNPYKVRIGRNAWEVEYKSSFVPLNKNDFSFTAGGATVQFHFAYITIHGTPGEDGTLQGYQDMLGIPYSNCGVMASALTFNKYICNNFLKNFGIDVAESLLLRKRDSYQPNKIIEEIGLPLFVKPNVGGSSFATTKVKEPHQLEKAIQDAFVEAGEVMVERYIQGVEVTCGCFETEKGFTMLPLTEVVTENEFFDYNAKYMGEVEEITPARIPGNIAKQIQQETEKIYRLIDAKGIIRADYILVNNHPVLLEVNTTPGMTSTSFIPQQVEAAGLTMGGIITDIIETECNKINTTPLDRFRDIRPLLDKEVPASVVQLSEDKRFRKAAEQIIKPLSWEQFSVLLLQCKSKHDFQEKVIYPIMSRLIKETTTEMAGLGWDKLPPDGSHIYISNHRDIVLDAAFFNILLFDKQMDTTEIAIGDNLLVYPWIEKLVRLNKSFIVKRGVSVRQMLEVSKHLSEYIHETVTVRKQSIWLAQREGRAKDSNDKTQASLLKMLTLHDSSRPLEALKQLQIVPLSISYEYDPCDFLKAKEFQLKRDNPEYKKTQADDIENMYTGIVGFKGRVIFRLGACINSQLNMLPDDIGRKELLDEVAGIIDGEIFRNYSFFPINYVAYDLMTGTSKFASMYTPEEKEDFSSYLNRQVEKINIQQKDNNFLREKMIEMYGNTLKNHLTVT